MDGLPGAFIFYLQQHAEVLESIRNFQAAHRQYFMVATEEYPLEATYSYHAFVQLVDYHLNNFLREQGATVDDFSNAMLAMKASQDPHWMAFDLLLQKVDFQGFASLLRSNTCLCCGGVFMAHADAMPAG
mmetsp:Transcript_52401/g.94059  ORF Transcript_52401/g.94059 Transcript_52401/m.94059 type:complete len:130 (+) Transcript_52401:79-468(+)